MGALAHNDVLLFILDLGKEFGETADYKRNMSQCMVSEKLDSQLKRTFAIKRIGRDIALAHVDDSVHVKGHLLSIGTPVLVAEAIGVLSIILGDKGVIAVGDGLLVGLVLALRVGDLSRRI